MPNNSASGGYLVPSSSTPLPGNLSLEDFIQTVIVGISGITGTLVRPKWQRNPPKNPDIDTDWIAFGIQQSPADSYAYAGLNDQGVNVLQRQEQLDIQLSFYGPNALENMAVFRDGFQIQQNLEAMRLAQMGYTGITPGIRGPDLLNERWVERWEMTLSLTRQVQRVYPVLSFASARGTVDTVLASDYTQTFEVEEPES